MKKFKESYISNFFRINKIDFYICWEDIEIIQEALNINNNDVIFSIISGGCNIFNMLLYNPKKIIAVDYNPYQVYLLELKIAAIRKFSHSKFLQFMGINISNNNKQLYLEIRKDLSLNARKFWDINYYVIKKGLLRVGEPDLKIFGKLLRFLKGKEKIENFFLCNTIKEQKEYFYKNIYGFPWKFTLNFLHNRYISKICLCLIAILDYPFKRKKTFNYINYIQYNYIPKNHNKKIKRIYTEIPIKYNYFASLYLLSNYFNENCYPPYLKKKNFYILKRRVNRVEIKINTVIDYLISSMDDSYTKFNLSNIFDWLNKYEFKLCLNEIIRVSKNNGKIYYSITRTDRSIPKEIKKIQTDKKLSKKLIEKDRSLLYSNFISGTICK